METIKARVMNRIGTPAEWTASNPVILKGEIALIDRNGIIGVKVGDGIKTFNELEDNVQITADGAFQGGIDSLSFNPGPQTIPVYYISALAGTYPNFGGLVLPANSFGIFYWNGTQWKLSAMEISITGYVLVTDIINDLTTGGTNKPLSAEAGKYINDILLPLKLSKSDVPFIAVGKNEVRTDLIQLGYFNTAGTFFASTTAKYIKGQPVIAGQVYVISGIVADANKKIIFRDIEGAIVQQGGVNSSSMSAMPRTITAPTGSVTVDIMIRTEADSGDSVFATFQWEKGSTATTYEAPIYQIGKILGKDILTKYITTGNEAPTPDNGKAVVPLNYMINNYQGLNFIGTIKPDSSLSQQRNIITEVITDIKISGGVPGKVYMLRGMAFKHSTLKDYTAFHEGTLNSDGTVTTERIFTPIASGVVNPDIPTGLTGKAYSSYTLGDGIKAEIWFDFDRKNTWTLFNYSFAVNTGDVAYNCFVNQKKTNQGVNRLFVRNNYQDKIYKNAIQSPTSTNGAQVVNLLEEVIEDIRITGAQDTDVFMIFEICFDHATLKDYFRIKKGVIDAVTGFPTWTSNETLYSGAEHPDYPTPLAGKFRAVYNLQAGVKMEIWYNFDRKTFTNNPLQVSNTTSSPAYYCYFSKIKMIPIQSVSGGGSYPLFTTQKFLLFADSITDPEGGAKQTWVQKAMLALGSPTWISYADGGAQYRSRSAIGITDIPAQLANAAGQINVDAVFFGCGTNDWHGSPGYDGILGSYDECMSKEIVDLDTVNILYDAIRYAFYTAQNRWNCKMYVMLPLQRPGWDMTLVNPIIEALTLLGIRYGANILDGRACGIVKDFEVVGGEGRDLIDGIHPKNEAAYDKIGRMFISAVRTYQGKVS